MCRAQPGLDLLAVHAVSDMHELGWVKHSWLLDSCLCCRNSPCNACVPDQQCILGRPKDALKVLELLGYCMLWQEEYPQTTCVVVRVCFTLSVMVVVIRVNLICCPTAVPSGSCGGFCTCSMHMHLCQTLSFIRVSGDMAVVGRQLTSL